MGGVFACPECGNELQVRGLSPGRQVRCGWCEALVEVPFIPRAPAATRSRRGPKRRSPWILVAWGVVGLCALAVVTAGSARLVRTRALAAQEKTLAELTASAQAAEAAGRLDRALAETEAALAVLRKLEPHASERVQALQKHRDELARREVGAKLAAIRAGDPASGVGECLTLLARVEKSPALAELEDSVREALEGSSRRCVAMELAAAREAFESGRPDEGLRACDRIAKVAEHLARGPRRTALAEAKTLVSEGARKYGVVLGTVRGQFALGTAIAYTNALRPVLAEQLKAHGYTACPASSPWCSDWEAAAPYRLQVEVVEEMPDYYMQSKNRVSRITARAVLSVHGKPIWERSAIGRTEVPLPNIPAYQGARVAMGSHHSPDFERLLHASAYAALLDQAGRLLRIAPDNEAAVPPTRSHTPRETSGKPPACTPTPEG